MAEFRPEAACPVGSVETPRAGGGPGQKLIPSTTSFVSGNHELAQINGDLVNLLTTVDIPTTILAMVILSHHDF
jgi:hypothetical protein